MAAAVLEMIDGGFPFRDNLRSSKFRVIPRTTTGTPLTKRERLAIASVLAPYGPVEFTDRDDPDPGGDWVMILSIGAPLIDHGNARATLSWSCTYPCSGGGAGYVYQLHRWHDEWEVTRGGQEWVA